MNKLFSLLIILLSGCTGIPEGVEPVRDFDLSRYLGTWYEIARLDHSFERGLVNVSATYSLNEDGSVHVINKGFDPETNAWKSAEGKAKFISDPSVGRLKVSFFGPFYGAYNVIDLDRQNYSFAAVCGPDRSYFWILARQPKMDPQLLSEIVANAEKIGFKTDELIYVKQP